MRALHRSLLAFVILSLALTGCADTRLLATPDRVMAPADWQAQLAIAMHYAQQMSADPVLISVQASPTTDQWATDAQAVPILATSFTFADGSDPNLVALATTVVRFTNPPITGTIEPNPSIIKYTVPIAGYVKQRLSMRDAFVTMKMGPQDVYRMTAREGLDFLGSNRDRESLALGVLDVQQWQLEQFIPAEKRPRAPLLVWIALYSRATQKLRFIIDPYTGEVLVRDAG